MERTIPQKATQARASRQLSKQDSKERYSCLLRSQQGRQLCKPFRQLNRHLGSSLLGLQGSWLGSRQRGSQLGSSLGSQVGSKPLGQPVRQQASGQPGKPGKPVGQPVRQQAQCSYLRRPFCNQLRSQLRHQLRHQFPSRYLGRCLGSYLGSQLRSQLRSQQSFEIGYLN